MSQEKIHYIRQVQHENFDFPLEEGAVIAIVIQFSGIFMVMLYISDGILFNFMIKINTSLLCLIK